MIEELKAILDSDDRSNLVLTLQQAISDGTITTREEVLKGWEEVTAYRTRKGSVDCFCSQEKADCKDSHNCQLQTLLRPIQKSPKEQAIEKLEKYIDDCNKNVGLGEDILVASTYSERRFPMPGLICPIMSGRRLTAMFGTKPVDCYKDQCACYEFITSSCGFITQSYLAAREASLEEKREG